jgi:hypothetical protein
MVEQGYERCHFDYFIYFNKLDNGSFIILLLYVDDMLFVGSKMKNINEIKYKLENSFSMKDLGTIKQILGMRITKDRKNIKLFLCQSEYVEKVLKWFNIKNENLLCTPFPSHFKLTKEMCPKIKEEEEKIFKIPYASIVNRLM